MCVCAQACVCLRYGARAECESLVNKSCQMSLSWRYRSSSGSCANSEYLGAGTTHDEMPLSCISFL